MASLSTPNPSRADQPGTRVLKDHLILVCQLLLLLKVIQVFDIEGRRQLLPLMGFATGGFLVQYWLPVRYRLMFFLALSCAAFAVILGLQQAGMVVAIGLALIGICHLPVSFWMRVILLVAAAAGLAWARVAEPMPFWPILGSMFMFRLVIYLREMDSVRGQVPWAQRLSYFFLLPNVCFPFFPVVDYQVFVKTYCNEADAQIAQRGVAWILRGVVHIVLYRFIKYQVLPPPEDILNVADAAMFLAANYALYLYVSGTFHLIAGVLHLFGFNLPRTHDWFFLAHSFSDIWRRINIYWKDFLSQHIFFPTFFYLRGAGDRLGIVLAVAIVFGCTWLLHSYQVFWLLGEFPLRRFEAALWFIAGSLVAVNSLVDYHFARSTRAPANRSPVWKAVRRSFQIPFVFFCVSIFWGTWTYPTMLPSLVAAARHTSGFSQGWNWLLGIVVALITLLTGWQLARQRLKWPKWADIFRFEQSPLPTVSIAAGLLIMGQEPIQQLFHTDTARILASLKVDYPTTLDLARSVPGYYEELAAANLQVDALFSREVPRPRQGELVYSDITRPRNDLLELELIPRWRGILAGTPMSINRWGMRDGPVYHDKPGNVVRVAVVGSSVVMGYGVRDNEVFTELLEKKLNENGGQEGRSIELLNFGVGRYYALHIAAALREKIFEFQPDAVFYVAHQGELYGPLSHLARFRYARHPMPYDCLDDLMRKAGITNETSWGSMQGILQPHARQITLCIYRGIVADCRERGITPVWIYLPMPGIVEVSANTSQMLKLAEQAGFQVVDLSHWAHGRKPEEVKLNALDHHANGLGHQIIAAAQRDTPSR